MNIDSKMQEQIKQTLFEDDQKWFTLTEVADKTGLNADTDDLQEMLNTSREFVQSTRSKEGKAVYATKEDFKKTTPFFIKLKGAFKNRID